MVEVVDAKMVWYEDGLRRVFVQSPYDGQWHDAELAVARLVQFSFFPWTKGVSIPDEKADNVTCECHGYALVDGWVGL